MTNEAENPLGNQQHSPKRSIGGLIRIPWACRRPRSGYSESFMSDAAGDRALNSIHRNPLLRALRRPPPYLFAPLATLPVAPVCDVALAIEGWPTELES